VEIRSSEFTNDKIALQRGTDFLKAFMLGFDIEDAVAMLRLDDLYIESFEIKDGFLHFFSKPKFLSEKSTG
jgi:RNA-binding protein PNO1